MRLLDFVTAASPNLLRPDHLLPLANLIERAVRGERVRALVAAPPRHGTTELILHGIAWALSARPQDMIAYATYSNTVSKTKARAAATYALKAGVGTIRHHCALETGLGGGILPIAVGGAMGGHLMRVFFVNDPFKGLAEATSSVHQGMVYDWFQQNTARLAPDGAIIVVHPRWARGDLIGRLLDDRKRWDETSGVEGDPWEYVNIQAINNTGNILWPERWTSNSLEAARHHVGGELWGSLYQGQPSA